MGLPWFDPVLSRFMQKGLFKDHKVLAAARAQLSLGMELSWWPSSPHPLKGPSEVHSSP